MQTLEQIMANLKARSHQLEERILSNKLQVSDPQWERCISWVNSQVANPAKVISDHPMSVHYKLSGKHNRVQVNLGIVNGFEVQFILYDPIGEGEQKAFYVAFNENTNQAYTRKLWEI